MKSLSNRWTLVRDDEGQQNQSLLSTQTSQRRNNSKHSFYTATGEHRHLASGIAHDLNNVLAPIMMSAQLLQMKISQSGVAAAEGGKQCQTWSSISQVLSFARGLEGKRTILQVRHLIGNSAHCQETFPKSIEFTQI